MRILIAPDSYKECLTAKEVSEVMYKACDSVLTESTIKQMPMADGGEGSLEAYLHAVNGKKNQIRVTGAYGQQIDAFYGLSEDGQEAFIEIAEIVGLQQVPINERSPLQSTTYGVGEMLNHILHIGVKRVTLGLGGSATNDAGVGMLQALGVQFKLSTNHLSGKSVLRTKDLLNVQEVDFSTLNSKINELNITVATDVDNRLTGETGATFVFGRQKGLQEKELQSIDKAIRAFANKIETSIGKDYALEDGAGAAGGLGFALQVIDGNIENGASAISKISNLEAELKKADLVITGEGKSDHQTLFGKAPYYVAKLAKKYNIPVILLSGSIDDDSLDLNQYFDGVFSICQGPISFEESQLHAKQLIEKQLKRIVTFYTRLT
ncbi:glycerate kinase [Halalkalibacillus halophilus]|uniref:glycerate kinase n=1 Tax=Halalkalibacillus halophilus TaxID=392827 RepID=UPI0004190208|nr:glycerate kinase [Halalkalibacillus halophilus]